ncbi:MAG TPA: imelysin family protein [Methylibium sp.]|uniref:imelysin family protein n=1 Tax=Methylibium sp. TaxID=2067992 RepID=UPI002DB89119|nr:imelysin family protein [Methylibium sp.]HEU4457581.1 imelysin family protein [Methylibium sp.]
MRAGSPRRLVAIALLAAAAGARAAPVVAVPYYSAESYADGLLRDALLPRAAAFAEAVGALDPALRALCEAADAPAASRALQQARGRWGDAAGAWERLAAVAVGPVAERRSARQIDFAPTRPELIERAIRAAPADAAAMERVGSAAKGLPALEWLLWKQPPGSGSARCAYARQVALDVAREASALQAAYAEAAKADDEARVALLAEALNQWLGGVEALRGRQMERPLRTPAKDGARGFPRETSGRTASSWQQQWQALRSLVVPPAGREAPAPGAGLVPFELYLRGRGLNPLADRLARSVRAVDARMQGLRPDAPARVRQAAAALAALRTLVESEVAPALQVTLGFSDADGD